jgi:hypothetical protein
MPDQILSGAPLSVAAAGASDAHNAAPDTLISLLPRIGLLSYQLGVDVIVAEQV